jgi:hypothetical membrane protein
MDVRLIAVKLTALDRTPFWAGLVGTSVMTVTSVVTAVAYHGKDGETYSPFNHWVSELGQIGVSSLSTVFNAGLVIGGLLFAYFMVGLAATRTSRLRHAYGVIGLIAGLAGAGVGIFPMNHIGVHAIVALTFFNLGWIAVGLASIDIARRPEPRFPRWLAIIGALTVVAFVAFLVSLQTEGVLDEAGLAAPEVRRAFWIVPTLEWSLIVGIIAWVFLTAWTWRRAAR